MKCCTIIDYYCNSLSWLLPQGDKGDQGLMGPRGIKGHTGHKGDQVCSLFIVINITQTRIIALCLWSCFFLCFFLGPNGSCWSQRKWGKYGSTQWRFRWLLLPALVWIPCNFIIPLIALQGDPGVAGEPGGKGDQVRHIYSCIPLHPLIMIHQYVYSNLMVFNNGLQGPPGIPGIKGEVSLHKHSYIIGV